MENRLLFTPGKICNVELKNRMLMSAMHSGYNIRGEGAATGGRLSERELAYLEARAKGGAAAISIPVKYTQEGGPMSMLELGTSDEAVEDVKRIADTLHKYGCKYFPMIYHCGRNGWPAKFNGLAPKAPSATVSPVYKGVPEPLTKEEILRYYELAAKAAVRVKDAGADAIEINSTSGYLMPQFLSPLTNLREDEYGGSEENRMRFTIEMTRAIRKAVGYEFPVIFRTSMAQMMPGGYGIDLVLKLIAALDAEKLIDAVSVTGGWHESPIPQTNYHMPLGSFAILGETVRRVVNLPIIVSNRIITPEIAEDILQKGYGDFVTSARAHLADPEFVNKMHDNRPFNICQGCNRGCIELVIRGNDTACAFNAELNKEYIENKIAPVQESKKVLVVGGGPAGMYSAKKAAQRGYEAVLCTNEPVLGGTLKAASAPPHKENIMGFVENAKYDLEQLNVDVKVNTTVDAALIKEIAPDFVVVATGAKPFIPPIPGIQNDNVYLACDVLNGSNQLHHKLKTGKTVIIGGGSVSLETAEFLVEKAFVSPEAKQFLKYHGGDMYRDVYVPLDITVVEMASKMGKDMGAVSRQVMKVLKDDDVKLLTNTKVLEITEEGVRVETETGEQILAADNIVLAAGFKAIEPEFVETLNELKIPYAKVGDASAPRDVMAALSEVYELFRNPLI